MKPGLKLAILESAFFFLLAAIITSALIEWRQLALFLSIIVAIAGRIALDYYYKYISGCSTLSAKISMMPTITLLALAFVIVRFRQHPFLIIALFMLLFILVLWKVALLRNWIDRGQLKRTKE